MSTIVEGKKIAAAILDDLKVRVQKISKQKKSVTLAVVIVGDDKPSSTYVKKKEEAAQEVGIDFLKFEFKSDISKESLILQINSIQKEHDLSGLIIQLPLPQNLKPFTKEIIEQINPQIDVDCLTTVSLGKVLSGINKLSPPTPSAILEILKHYQIDLQGKAVLIIGRGDLIGKPLAAMLIHEPVSLTVCGKECLDLSFYTKQADIIICGVGKYKILSGKMVKKDCVVIDGGVCFAEQKMCGDVDFTSVSKKASLITPVPGGVGPITVAKLLENTVINVETKLKKLIIRK